VTGDVSLSRDTYSALLVSAVLFYRIVAVERPPPNQADADDMLQRVVPELVDQLLQELEEAPGDGSGGLCSDGETRLDEEEEEDMRGMGVVGVVSTGSGGGQAATGVHRLMKLLGRLEGEVVKRAGVPAFVCLHRGTFMQFLSSSPLTANVVARIQKAIVEGGAPTAVTGQDNVNKGGVGMDVDELVHEAFERTTGVADEPGVALDPDVLVGEVVDVLEDVYQSVLREGRGSAEDCSEALRILTHVERRVSQRYGLDSFHCLSGGVSFLEFIANAAGGEGGLGLPVELSQRLYECLSVLWATPVGGEAGREGEVSLGPIPSSPSALDFLVSDRVISGGHGEAQWRDEVGVTVTMLDYLPVDVQRSVTVGTVECALEQHVRAWLERSPHPSTWTETSLMSSCSAMLFSTFRFSPKAAESLAINCVERWMADGRLERDGGGEQWRWCSHKSTRRDEGGMLTSPAKSSLLVFPFEAMVGSTISPGETKYDREAENDRLAQASERGSGVDSNGGSVTWDTKRAFRMICETDIGQSCSDHCCWDTLFSRSLAPGVSIAVIDFVRLHQDALASARPDVVYVTVDPLDCIPLPGASAPCLTFQDIRELVNDHRYNLLGGWCASDSMGLLVNGETETFRQSLQAYLLYIFEDCGSTWHEVALGIALRTVHSIHSSVRHLALCVLVDALSEMSQTSRGVTERNIWAHVFRSKKILAAYPEQYPSQASMMAKISTSHKELFPALYECCCSHGTVGTTSPSTEQSLELVIDGPGSSATGAVEISVGMQDERKRSEEGEEEGRAQAEGKLTTAGTSSAESQGEGPRDQTAWDTEFGAGKRKHESFPEKDSEPQPVSVEHSGSNVKATDRRREFIKRLLIQDFNYQSDGTPPATNSAERRKLQSALEHLSTSLYSSDVHFVMELIQNADDNMYDENVVPTLKIQLYPHTVLVFNNEVGFDESNIVAVCNVGGSTKKGRNGYIGQKGIGLVLSTIICSRVLIVAQGRYCPYSNLAPIVLFTN